MARALALATRGEGAVEPNPMVGCVIVRDDAVIGEGWHQQFGGPHAEIEALRIAGQRANGATLYVTLEPCSHFGKTPPWGTVMTYRQLDDASRAFAAWLQKAAGLRRGDRVALMLPNLLQYPVALFGILRACMIVVNVNPLYTPRELEHQLKDSGARAIVILENFASVLQQVLGNTSDTPKPMSSHARAADCIA